MGMLDKIFKSLDVEGEYNISQVWRVLTKLDRQKAQLWDRLYRVEEESGMYSRRPKRG